MRKFIFSWVLLICSVLQAYDVVTRGQIELCMVGDSITWYAEGDGFREELLKVIPELAFVGKHTAQLGYSHAGEGGNNTRQILERVWDIPDCRYYHLLAGVNDCSAAKSPEDIERVAQAVAANLKRIADLLSSRGGTEKVFLGTILPCVPDNDPDSDAYLYRDQAASRVNEILRENFGAGDKIILVEYEKPLRARDDWKTVIRLHPRPEGYVLLAGILAPYLEKHTEAEPLPDTVRYGVEVINLYHPAEGKSIPVVPGWYVVSFQVVSADGDEIRFRVNDKDYREPTPGGGRIEVIHFTGYIGEHLPLELKVENAEKTDILIEKMRPSRRASVFGNGCYIDFQSPISPGEKRVAAEAVQLNNRCTVEAEEMRLNSDRAERVEVKQFSGKAGVQLKPEVNGFAAAPSGDPDLYFEVDVREKGIYTLHSTAAASKPKTDTLWLTIDGGKPLSRYVIVSWRSHEKCAQELQRVALSAGKHRFGIYLPEDLKLDGIEFRRYEPPRIPERYVNYRAPVTPPADRPRLLARPEHLPEIRRNFTKGEHAAVWEKVLDNAAQPANDILKDTKEKAFVYLMNGDEAVGRDAVGELAAYLPELDFGNRLDITREIGLVIFVSSLVYDWCHDLMSDDEKALFRTHLRRLAEDMEIGWPPFKQMANIGHGNEAQLLRDLLSWGIATYEDDPEPYNLTMGRILEEILPIHNDVYRSGRHDQGSNYGVFRISWEYMFHWIYERMTGVASFEPQFFSVPYVWLYQRLPNGQLLRDGDVYMFKERWGDTHPSFLFYTVLKDGILKDDFLKQNKGLPYLDFDLVSFLLFDDPELEADGDWTKLPLIHVAGEPLPAIIARTGWEMGPDSPDAIVEMKGGGLYYGNHQHLDAGSFQIYCGGILAADLGVYDKYGVPYDLNFTKRSVSHNVMLVYDPDETFVWGNNDGGQRFPNRGRIPASLEELRESDSRVGVTTASGSGPGYAFLEADLAAAYTAKVEAYRRSFLYLQLDYPETPALLVVLDRIASSNPAFTKYFQLNSLTQPMIEDHRVTVRNGGELICRTLLPERVKYEVVPGTEVFGRKYEPSRDVPEAHGFRTMISPAEPRKEDLFLHVLQISNREGTRELPLQFRQDGNYGWVDLEGHLIGLPLQDEFRREALRFTLKGEEASKVWIGGLAAGQWSLNGDAVDAVQGGEHHFFAELPPGDYHLEFTQQ